MPPALRPRCSSRQTWHHKPALCDLPHGHSGSHSMMIWHQSFRMYRIEWDDQGAVWVEHGSEISYDLG